MGSGLRIGGMGGLSAGLTGSSGKMTKLQERMAAAKSRMNLNIGMGNENDRLVNIQNKGEQLRTKFDEYAEHSFESKYVISEKLGEGMHA